jgi:hypothetical protein
MTDPYRACLAELLSKIDYTWGDIPADVCDLMNRTRILLTQTSDYIGWLYDQGTFEEQQQYEAKGLRAVFNAGRRTRGHQ